MTPLIELIDVSFSYPAIGWTTGKTVFDNFSLQAQRGETLVIGGKSGCGKTTLLRLMAWMEEPAGGGMFFDGKPYNEYSPPGLRRQISLVTQIPVMLEGTVRRNMTLGLTEPAPDETLRDWMERLDLDQDILDRPAEALSVGQRQRVAVIRNLLVKPKAMLLDEPTSGLDPESTETFIESMRRLTDRDGLTIVWNSHDIDDIASLATRVVMIGEGGK